MAEHSAKTSTPPAAAPAAASVPEKKRLPMRAIAIITVVMLIEGGAITTAFYVTRPGTVHAEVAATSQAAEQERSVEELVIAQQFQNTRSGKTYLYDTEIYVLVRQKHQAKVRKQIEAKKAQIVGDIATIFRSAERTQLLEPSLSALTRRIRASLDTHLEPEDGQSLIQEVVVPRCIEFRVEY
jgi:hypothetical protein